MKAARHRRIARILRRGVVASQTQLAELLRARGEHVTQATLSRDLEEMGAVKTRRADGSVAYEVPEEPPPNGAHLAKMLAEFLSGIEVSGSLVVLRTPPGGAQPVARAMDTAGVDGVIATVAGDDTILVVCAERVTGKTVARRIERIAAGRTEGANA
jgi:transcriptional regulator of arginine metabolism